MTNQDLLDLIKALVRLNQGNKEALLLYASRLVYLQPDAVCAIY